MKAVREDETAAQAMGINAFRIKTLAFTVSGFFGGVAVASYCSKSYRQDLSKHKTLRRSHRT
ncbi:MAG: hypothetical protein WCG29_10305 [Desulfomonile sp.]